MNYALWSVSNLQIYSPFQTKEIAEMVYRITSISWHLFPSLSFLFVVFLFNKEDKFPKWFLYFAIFVPSVFYWYGGNFVILTGFERQDFGYRSTFAPDAFWHLGYQIYLLGTTLLNVVLSMVWGIRSKSRRKFMQGFIIMISWVLSFALSFVTDIILFSNHISQLPLSVLFIQIWALASFFAIKKYSLLTLSPQVAAEEIVSHINYSVILTDPEMNILFVNGMTTDLLGYAKEEMINRKLGNYIHSFQDTAFASLPLNSTQPVSEITNFLTIEKEPVIMNTFLSPMNDRKGAFVGYLLLSKPIESMDAIKDKYEFTEREAEVFGLTIQGYDSLEIAGKLNISAGTVKTHLHNIYQKTNSKNKVELLRLV